jgi:hypothetical protein
MSWLNWFSRDKKKPRSSSRGASFVSAGGSQAAQGAAQRQEQRKTERNTKRELLFQAVRESMIRNGVLSSAFKFKVLSLDQRGRSFLVLIDLATELSGEVEKLTEIESLITQTARRRYELTVQAVYWRYFEPSAAHTPTAVPAMQPPPVAKPAAAAAAGASTLDQAKNKLLLTGYEDTELTDEEAIPALSGTQYGDLR